jgi:thioredoxin:protein disulfide reductase
LATSLSDTRLHWQIAPGYYLYCDRIDIAVTPPGNLQAVDKPTGDQKDDPNFDVMTVCHRTVTVKAPSAHELTETWQDCAQAGLCYPPQSRTISVSTPTFTLATNPTLTAPPRGNALPSTTARKERRQARLLNEFSMSDLIKREPDNHSAKVDRERS